MTDQKEILLKNIDTRIAANSFAKMLDADRSQTFFLNGAWGSGKTTFLKETEKYTSKNFVELKLWEIKDKRSFIARAFARIFPIWTITLKSLFLVCVVIALSTTNIVNLDIIKSIHFLPSEIVGAFVFVSSLIGLAVSVAKFFKIETDEIYIWFFNHLWGLKNKILIIDDFDRLNEDQKADAYKLFNLLNRKITIIFVGDYATISKNDNTSEKYLQKIIDKRVELPFVLQPNTIWSDYFQELSNIVDVEIDDDLVRVIVGERRNLRERAHFNDYVTRNFLENKRGLVQPNDQLWLIYLYLFHNNEYEQLLNNNVFKKPDSPSDDYHFELNPTAEYALQRSIYKLQSKPSDGYPMSYAKNKQAYYIYEVPTNMSLDEIDAVINNEDQLEEYLLSGYNSDYYEHLKSNFESFDPKRKEQMVEKSIDLVGEMKQVRM